MWYFALGFTVLSFTLFTIFYNSLPTFLYTIANPIVATPLALILNFLDWDSTKRLVYIYGSDIEQNPIARRLFKKYGVKRWGLNWFFKLVFGSLTLAIVTFYVMPPGRLAINLTLLIIVVMAYLEIFLWSRHEK